MRQKRCIVNIVKIHFDFCFIWWAVCYCYHFLIRSVVKTILILYMCELVTPQRSLVGKYIHVLIIRLFTSKFVKFGLLCFFFNYYFCFMWSEWYELRWVGELNLGKGSTRAAKKGVLNPKVTFRTFLDVRLMCEEGHGQRKDIAHEDIKETGNLKIKPRKIQYDIVNVLTSCYGDVCCDWGQNLSWGYNWAYIQQVEE